MLILCREDNLTTIFYTDYRIIIIRVVVCLSSLFSYLNVFTFSEPVCLYVCVHSFVGGYVCLRLCINACVYVCVTLRVFDMYDLYLPFYLFLLLFLLFLF